VEVVEAHTSTFENESSYRTYGFILHTSTLEYRSRILASARGEGDWVKTAVDLVHPIANHVGDRAAGNRIEGNPRRNGNTQLATQLLNGRDKFEKRVEALVQGSQQP
jgi:hypothetical protein